MSVLKCSFGIICSAIVALNVAFSQDSSTLNSANNPQDLPHLHTKDIDSSATNTSANNAESKPNTANISKSVSVKANAFSNEGYSEMELQSGHSMPNKTSLNELNSAPMVRHGLNLELGLVVAESTNVRLELFLQNSIGLNAQRRGNGIRIYDSVPQKGLYGEKYVQYMWVNSIGAAISFLKAHKILLTFKQTRLSTDEALLFSPQIVTNAPMVGNIASNIANLNPYMITTQFFITYSYVF